MVGLLASLSLPADKDSVEDVQSIKIKQILKQPKVDFGDLDRMTGTQYV